MIDFKDKTLIKAIDDLDDPVLTPIRNHYYKYGKINHFQKLTIVNYLWWKVEYDHREWLENNFS